MMCPRQGIYFALWLQTGKRATIIPERQQARQQAVEIRPTAVTLEQLFDRFQAGDVRELRLIIKADVQGSLEPIINSIKEMSTGEIAVNILHAETGNIGENDIMLASASKAIVMGFNVQADSAARRLAEFGRRFHPTVRHHLPSN